MTTPTNIFTQETRCATEDFFKAEKTETGAGRLKLLAVCYGRQRIFFFFFQAVEPLLISGTREKTWLKELDDMQQAPVRDAGIQMVCVSSPLGN